MKNIASISNKQKWLVGLIEAEGYIGFNVNGESKNGRKKWVFMLKVAMKNTNRRAIHKVKTIMGVGQVHEDKAGMVVYKLTDRGKIREKMYPILDNYPPRGVKYYEYMLLKKAMDVIEDETISAEQREQVLEGLKEKSKIKKQVTPVVSDKVEDWEKEAKEVIKDISIEKLREVYDPWWLAGFIEGDGSFQINSRLQIVFEVGQMYDKMAVYGIHKMLDVPGKIKERERDEYLLLSTKHPRVLDEIIEMLDGRMLGIKSFEFRIWKYAKNTTKVEKRARAKELLTRLRQKEEEGVNEIEGLVGTYANKPTSQKPTSQQANNAERD